MSRYNTLTVSNILPFKWAVHSLIYGLKGVAALWTLSLFRVYHHHLIGRCHYNFCYRCRHPHHRRRHHHYHEDDNEHNDYNADDYNGDDDD